MSRARLQGPLFRVALPTLLLMCVMSSTAADKATATDPDGTTPLHWAVYNGDATQVDALLKSHADVNARNRFGSTPLYEAALAGNTAIIRKLLKAGANPNVANEGGMTALMIVARTPNAEAAEALVK